MKPKLGDVHTVKKVGEGEKSSRGKDSEKTTHTALQKQFYHQTDELTRVAKEEEGPHIPSLATLGVLCCNHIMLNRLWKPVSTYVLVQARLHDSLHNYM